MKIDIKLDKIIIYTMSGNSSFNVGESRLSELSFKDQSQGTNCSIGDSSTANSKMINLQESISKTKKDKKSKIEGMSKDETPALTGIYP